MKKILALLFSKTHFQEDGSFWPVASMFIASFFSFLNAVLLSRLFAPEEYGVYRYVLAWIILSSFFTLSGSHLPLTQAIQGGKDSTFFSVLKMRMRYGFLGVLFFLSIAAYYYLQGNTQLSLLFALYAPFVAVSETLTSYVAFLYGKKKVRLNFYIDLFSAILGSVSVILAVYFTQSIVIAFLANIVSTWIPRLIGVAYVASQTREATETENVEKYSFKLTLSNSFEALAQSLDKMIVFHFLGGAGLSFYIFATLFVDQIREVLRILIWKYILIDSSENNYRDKVSFRKVFLYSFGLFLVYAIFAPLLYKLFFPQYVSVVFLSIVYSLSFFSSVVFISMYEYQLQKKTRHVIIYNVVLLALILVGVTVGSINYGVTGAVIGLLAARLISSVGMLRAFK